MDRNEMEDFRRNTIRHALGSRSTPEFLVDPERKVIHKLVWSHPRRFREQLEKCVGPVERPTRVEDLKILKMKTAAPYLYIASIALY